MARDAAAISVYRGDSYPVVFTLKDKATKAAIDLTGSTVKMTVDSLKEPPDNTTKVFEVAGVLDADPTTGKVSFLPTATNTATAGTFFYDVQLTGADGSVRTVAKSTFTITMDITK